MYGPSNQFISVRICECRYKGSSGTTSAWGWMLRLPTISTIYARRSLGLQAVDWPIRLGTAISPAQRDGSASRRPSMLKPRSWYDSMDDIGTLPCTCPVLKTVKKCVDKRHVSWTPFDSLPCRYLLIQGHAVIRLSDSPHALQDEASITYCPHALKFVEWLLMLCLKQDL